VYGAEFIQGYFANFSNRVATDVMYTTFMQNEFSAANYWHSPFDEESSYLVDNIFLPLVNNQVLSSNSKRYKDNFLNAKKHIFFASPADGTVIPWQTCIWGFYDENENITPMEQQSIYTQDLFGLKTSDSRGSLECIVVDGVQHSAWLTDRVNFVKHVLPFLA